MSDEEFEKLVGEALDSLPPEFAEKLNNVAVTFDNYPTPLQMWKAKVPPWGLLFGLYEGVPQTKRGIYYSAPPDRITIFKYSILHVSHSPDEVREQVRRTVIHEIGHHFGLSDAELN